jgi:hypothetical protein
LNGFHLGRVPVDASGRVGTALARGAFGPLLDGLHPRGHVEDDHWVVDSAPRTIATDLRLAPMVSAPKAVLLGTTCSTPGRES